MTSSNGTTDSTNIVINVYVNGNQAPPDPPPTSGHTVIVKGPKNPSAGSLGRQIARAIREERILSKRRM